MWWPSVQKVRRLNRLTILVICSEQLNVHPGKRSGCTPSRSTLNIVPVALAGDLALGHFGAIPH